MLSILSSTGAGGGKLYRPLEVPVFTELPRGSLLGNFPSNVRLSLFLRAKKEGDERGEPT
jgi:hypothetical protein